MDGFPYFSQHQYQRVPYCYRHNVQFFGRSKAYSRNHVSFSRQNNLRLVDIKVRRNLRVPRPTQRLARGASYCYYEIQNSIIELKSGRVQNPAPLRFNFTSSSKQNTTHEKASTTMGRLSKLLSSSGHNKSSLNNDSSSISGISRYFTSTKSSQGILKGWQAVRKLFLPMDKSKDGKPKISIQEISDPVLISSSLFSNHDFETLPKSSSSTLRTSSTTNSIKTRRKSTSDPSWNFTEENYIIKKHGNMSKTYPNVGVRSDELVSLRSKHSEKGACSESIRKENTTLGHLKRSLTVSDTISTQQSFNRERQNSLPTLQTPKHSSSICSKTSAPSSPQSLQGLQNDLEHVQQQRSTMKYLNPVITRLYSKDHDEYGDSIGELSKLVENEITTTSCHRDATPFPSNKRTRFSTKDESLLGVDSSVSDSFKQQQHFYVEEDLVPRPLEPRCRQMSTDHAFGRSPHSKRDTPEDQSNHSAPHTLLRSTSLLQNPAPNSLFRTSSCPLSHSAQRAWNHPYILVTNQATDTRQLPYTPDKYVGVDEMLDPIDDNKNPIGVCCISTNYFSDTSSSMVISHRDRQIRSVNTTKFPDCSCSMCNPLSTAVLEEEPEGDEHYDSNENFEAKLKLLNEDILHNGKTILTSKYFRECLRMDD
jgi:hypothetical protein